MGQQHIVADPIHSNAAVDKIKKRRIKASMSSKGTTDSFNSGPWSVDWLENMQQGDIGLISSKKKRLRKVGK
jgi:hypothetical protein